MPVDWAATGTWMQAWAGFAQAGAVVFVAVKGTSALETWASQKLAERRFEAAERILLLSYRLERVFGFVRSGMMEGSELDAAEERLKTADWFDDLDPGKRKGTIYGRAILTRLDSAKREWEELLAVIPLARAIFGKDLADALQSIWSQRAAVEVAAEMYGDDNGQEQDFTAKLKRDMWEGYEREKNEVTLALRSAFEAVERTLLAVLADPIAPRRW